MISNSSKGELESKHQIGKKMRSVNSGMALHQSAEQTGGAKANKNNPLQLDKTSLHIMPVV